MLVNFKEKIRKLGGVERVEEMDKEHARENNEYIKTTMGALPEDEVIDFIKEYGLSTFNNSVYISPKEKSEFLTDDKIKLGMIYGFGHTKKGVKEIIRTYYREEQLNKRFYPLFEGFPGDIIFFSLEPATHGKIYYWHHKAEPGNNIQLIKDTFNVFIASLYTENEK